MPFISIQMLKNKTTEFNNYFLICSLDPVKYGIYYLIRVGYKEIIILNEIQNNK